MKQKWFFIIVPALVLLGAGVYLLIAGATDAAAVEQSVLRFHVVGASDSAEDQQIKCKVRDGMFDLMKQLFADCKDRQAALEKAARHQEQLQQTAEQLLRQEGSDAAVAVEIGERFFPTKQYGALSFPAGTYQAVSIRIGEAEGKNFWCVLYPALCIAPAVAEDTAADEMAAVLGKERVEFLQKGNFSYKLRFALAEWWGNFIQKIGSFEK
ncbi:MAG: stage II sporulation protein R [Clostridia bacterium]|nr:stage II sporulation protein R [Clostridia bacterium]